MTNTRKRSFDVYLPGSKDTPPQFVETIKVEVYDNFGEEFLTQESRDRIESIKARELGLMSGSDIKRLRKRHSLTQNALASLINCGKKSIPRWENGNGYPSGVVNTILRLLDEGAVSIATLRDVQGPRLELASDRFARMRESKVIPHDFRKSRISQSDKDWLQLAQCK